MSIVQVLYCYIVDVICSAVSHVNLLHVSFAPLDGVVPPHLEGWRLCVLCLTANWGVAFCASELEALWEKSVMGLLPQPEEAAWPWLFALMAEPAIIASSATALFPKLTDLLLLTFVPWGGTTSVIGWLGFATISLWIGFFILVWAGVISTGAFVPFDAVPLWNVARLLTNRRSGVRSWGTEGPSETLPVQVSAHCSHQEVVGLLVSPIFGTMVLLQVVCNGFAVLDLVEE